jgi:DNA-binding NarL/FixJ family response regulator
MNNSKNSEEKITILIVDDHQMLLDLWFFILSRDGRFQVVGKADNGKLAVEIAKSKRPDVVIVDINMPQLDGFETTKLIRRYSPASRIIAISVYALPAYAKKMKQIGGMGYVTKNSPASELIKAIIEVYNYRPYFCSQIEKMMEQEQKLHVHKKITADSLTRREMEIIQLIEQGFTSREIADKLFLSVKTIHIHRHKIFKKLQVKNVMSLIKKAQSLGLV